MQRVIDRRPVAPSQLTCSLASSAFFWHRLLEPASSRTSFLVGGQVQSVMVTSISVWPVVFIQTCRLARLLAGRRSGTRCQCRKNTVSCLHVTQSRSTGHGCLQLHLWRLVAGSADRSLWSSSRRRGCQGGRRSEALVYPLRISCLSLRRHRRHIRYARVLVQA